MKKPLKQLPGGLYTLTRAGCLFRKHTGFFVKSIFRQKPRDPTETLQGPYRDPCPL